ncbi:MAG: Ldh family oxidoreductase [Armatimonadetes bacterium]|nr:Ldh family oxidoreductase [Armatimonadota bacterium]
MRTVMPDELRALVSSIFQTRGGVCERNSDIVAGCLVHANLRGVESHGVIRVPHYIKRLGIGSVDPRPNQKIERTGPSTATVDGDDGLGHPAVWDAMNLALEIAKETGVGFVGINHSSHCGTLSYYTAQAIEAGMIGMAFSQTDPAVVPFGGRKPFCGTNPLCFGVPSRTGAPIVLDMATSTVAGGHIFKARTENKEIPATWGLDENGNPTTDPHKAIYFTPAGGAKGYGLGVIVDALTGALSGGTFGPHVIPMYDMFETKRDLCHLVGALDYKRFAGAEFFLEMISRMVEEIHQVPPAAGFDRVLAPGEPEHLRQIERAKNGIPLEDYIWENLINLTGEAVSK